MSEELFHPTLSQHRILQIIKARKEVDLITLHKDLGEKISQFRITKFLIESEEIGLLNMRKGDVRFGKQTFSMRLYSLTDAGRQAAKLIPIPDRPSATKRFISSIKEAFHRNKNRDSIEK